MLIAKVQHGAPHPQTVLERFTNPGDESSEDGFDFASDIESEEDDEPKGAWMGDVEWIAFEVFQDDESDDDDDEEDEDSESETDLLPAMSSLTLNSSPEPSPLPLLSGISLEQQHSSLSLLEYLLRLSALQTFEQQSHMQLTDEHIVLFLRDDNSSPRQQQTFEPQRPSRRRSSIVSISSDFSSRGLRGLPLSPPRSDDMDPGRGTNTSFHSTPITGITDKPPERPIAKATRTNLERAMAADYDPMTLVTPPVNRRITRNGPRKVAAPKVEAHGSNSAPGSLQRNYTISATGTKSGTNNSPLAGKAEGTKRSASSRNHARNG